MYKRTIIINAETHGRASLHLYWPCVSTTFITAVDWLFGKQSHQTVGCTYQQTKNQRCHKSANMKTIDVKCGQINESHINYQRKKAQGHESDGEADNFQNRLNKGV